MDPDSWKDMVERTRELETALGSSIKKIENNEKNTVILQRRALRASLDLSEGNVLTESDVFPLRPCPADSLQPNNLKEILGMKLTTNIKKGDILRWKDLKSE